MSINIIYKLNGAEFVSISETISEAYRDITAIVRTNKLMFPNQEEELSEQMVVLTKIKSGEISSFENLVFKIEAVNTSL